MTRTGSITSPFDDLRTALLNPKLADGHHIYLRNGVHTLEQTTIIQASNVTIEPYPGERAVIRLRGTGGASGFRTLSVEGNNVTFRRIEFAGEPTSRITDYFGNYAPLDLFEVMVQGTSPLDGASFEGCLFHDLMGARSFHRSLGGNLFRDCLFWNNGYAISEGKHTAGGEDLYTQNRADAMIKSVDNMLAMPGYDQVAIQAYSAGSSPVENYDFNRVILAGGEFFGSSVTPLVNVTVRNCAFWSPRFLLGFGTKPNADNMYINNYAVLDEPPALYGVVSNTGNTYIKRTGGTFPDTNHVIVNACSIAPFVAFIAVYNWQQLEAVSIDVSSLNMTTGARYRLRNGYDYHGDYVDFDYDGSGSVSAWMTGRTVAIPVTASAPLVTPDIRFGAFVLETV